jgi:multidrug efflux pump subunit AcrA (membrane-fusion protein)
MPGAYAEIHLRLPAATRALVVPVTSMIFRSAGLQVAVVRGDTVEMVPVTQGRDFGTEVEITSGITGNDLVVINTPDSLTAGAKVHAELADQRH